MAVGKKSLKVNELLHWGWPLKAWFVWQLAGKADDDLSYEFSDNKKDNNAGAAAFVVQKLFRLDGSSIALFGLNLPQGAPMMQAFIKTEEKLYILELIFGN